MVRLLRRFDTNVLLKGHACWGLEYIVAAPQQFSEMISHERGTFNAKVGDTALQGRQVAKITSPIGSCCCSGRFKDIFNTVSCKGQFSRISSKIQQHYFKNKFLKGIKIESFEGAIS